MLALPYCILLLFVLQHRKVSAASVTNGPKPDVNFTGVEPRDCSDIRDKRASWVYSIYPGNGTKRKQVDVYCDFDSSNDSWLVIQRRKDGSENFYRSFKEYAKGFGDKFGEFWAGNELLYLLTSSKKYKLRVDLEDFEGVKKYAEYSTFIVNSADDFYRLTIGGYSGNAGDSFRDANGMRFSTRDIDKDLDTFFNCAMLFRSAWWYSGCFTSNLNSLYLLGHHETDWGGIDWFTWHGSKYSLKKTEMKLAPLEN